MPAHTAPRSDAHPTGARHRAGRRPRRPQAAWPPGSARPAESAAAPRGETFSHRAHSASRSKRLGDRDIVSRERSYRLTFPVRQLWPDTPARSFRGQAPREGTHGLPVALSPLVTPSTPAVWMHVVRSGPLPVPRPIPLRAHTPTGGGHGGTRKSNTSRRVHTRSVSPAAIAGVRGRHCIGSSPQKSPGISNIIQYFN